MSWRLPEPGLHMTNAVFDGATYAVDVTYPPTPVGVPDDVALVGQVLSHDPSRPGWVAMPVVEAEAAGHRTTERIENAPHVTYCVPSGYRAGETGTVSMRFHFTDNEGRKRTGYESREEPVPDNPEMTAEEQAKRRAERKAAQLKAMDRSTGYWCERDSDNIPYMRCPDGSHRYWPPDKDPTKLSADRPHGDSLEYAVCPMTGQVHNAADTEWWREHYGRLADEALNAAEEYQLDQHDPDWRGKKGGVLHSNKAVSDKVPEPQRSFLTYAVEEQHGFAHQLKWARVLLATNYEWRGMMGSQMETVFEAAESEGPMDYEGCLEFYEAHGRNKRWTKAKDWFEANGATPRDLQAEERATHARRRAEAEKAPAHVCVGDARIPYGETLADVTYDVSPDEFGNPRLNVNANHSGGSSHRCLGAVAAGTPVGPVAADELPALIEEQLPLPEVVNVRLTEDPCGLWRLEYECADEPLGRDVDGLKRYLGVELLIGDGCWESRYVERLIPSRAVIDGKVQVRFHLWPKSPTNLRVSEHLVFRLDVPERHSPDRADSPYVYGEDLTEAQQAADAEGNVLEYTAITAEIDLRMTDKANLPASVTLLVVAQVESRYPKIRLDKVRAALASEGDDATDRLESSAAGAPTTDSAGTPPTGANPDLVKLVRRYWRINQKKPNKGENWRRVLIAFGDIEDDGAGPYTAAEARASERTWRGWQPIRRELERLEAAASDSTATPLGWVVVNSLSLG